MLHVVFGRWALGAEHERRGAGGHRARRTRRAAGPHRPGAARLDRPHDHHEHHSGGGGRARLRLRPGVRARGAQEHRGARPGRDGRTRPHHRRHPRRPARDAGAAAGDRRHRPARRGVARRRNDVSYAGRRPHRCASVPPWASGLHGGARGAHQRGAACAGRARVACGIARDGDALGLEVRQRRAVHAAAHNGRTAEAAAGLSGIRDRVDAARRTVVKAGAEAGGFAVRALLPLDASLSPEAPDPSSPWASLREKVSA